MAQPNVIPIAAYAAPIGDPRARELGAERRNEIVVIIGAKGSGKSTQARRILAERPRRLIVDPMWEHTQGAIVRDFDSMVAYLRRVRSWTHYGVVLRTLSDDDRDRAIALCTAGTPEDPPLPDVTLLVDEIDRLCSPSSIPEPLARAVNYGRHYRVSLIALARRPQQMHRDITANADKIIVGKVQEPRDLEYLEAAIGERLTARARELREFEFVSWPDDLEESPASSAVAGRARAARAREGSPQ